MADGDVRNQHVLIVGAGIAGLLVAQGLQKHGVPFTIFESEASSTDYRPRDWGMSIQWALPMLSDLLPEHVTSKLYSVSVDPFYECPDFGTSMPTYNAESGEKLKDIPLVKFIRVSRRKMRALCTSGLDVQYGKALSSVDTASENTGIKAIFKDGTSATGTLLVGADGANSTVRSELFPNAAGKSQQIPYGGVNMHLCYHDADVARFIRQSFTPIQAIGVHPRGYWLWMSIQDVPDPKKAEDWVFQLQWTWRTGPETASLAGLELEKLKEEASAAFDEPYRTAWLNIPEGTRVPANKTSVWHPQRIPQEAYNGRVALVGDAAHAMSFHRGQGLNHGIADACKLVEALTTFKAESKVQKEAVLEYESEMIQRAGEEVDVSKMNTEMMHDWPRLKESPFMQRGGDRNK